MSVPGDFDWRLTFDDEFNGTALDASKWNDSWFGAPGVVTKPVNTAEYAAYDPANVSVSGGYLHLEAEYDPVRVGKTNYDYRSGIATTYGKFDQAYGYFEARVFNPGVGDQIANWPAFWINGENWPQDGEADIMEGLDGQAAFHYHSAVGDSGAVVPGDYTGWHVFAALWEPGLTSFYYDNQLVGSIAEGVADVEQYMILNHGVGRWGGPDLIPADMMVDWVHVYSADPSAVAVDAQDNYAGFGGFGGDPPPPPPDPSVINGTAAADMLIGTALAEITRGLDGDDTIRGLGGNDVIGGGTGRDVLIGGPGGDTFVFAELATTSDRIQAGDGAIAFEGAGDAAGDLIDLSGIDADATLDGDQAFIWGGTGPGRLSLSRHANDTYFRGDTDGDAAFEFSAMINDGGVAHTQYTAADFIL